MSRSFIPVNDVDVVADYPSEDGKGIVQVVMPVVAFVSESLELAFINPSGKVAPLSTLVDELGTKNVAVVRRSA